MPRKIIKRPWGAPDGKAPLADNAAMPSPRDEDIKELARRYGMPERFVEPLRKAEQAIRCYQMSIPYSSLKEQKAVLENLAESAAELENKLLCLSSESRDQLLATCGGLPLPVHLMAVEPAPTSARLIAAARHKKATWMQLENVIAVVGWLRGGPKMN
jgi:hypothetical protein